MDADPGMLNVLSLATLFPDATRPNFGIFVERSLAALVRQAGVSLTICAPVGVPPWPLSLHPRYAALRTLPAQEEWHGLRVLRPRFLLIPGLARRNAAAVARAVLPHAKAMQARGAIDVIDAQFFWPDGPAAHRLAQQLDLPFSIKARGGDINLWARRKDVRSAIIAAASAATGMLAVAHSLRQDMVSLGMAAERITVHYTGLDATRFRVLGRSAAREKWGVPSDVPVVITVGTLSSRKGQALVLAAMRALPPDTHYLMAGIGPDAAHLAKMAGDLGIGERVRQLGSIAHDDLPSLYAAADVMALPSESEGLANVWVEALACGVPLLLSDIPPAHELLDAPDAGVIAARHPDAIADAIRRILANPPDRAKLSGRTHARFNWEQNGAELAQHLRAMAEQFRKGESVGADT